MTRVYHGTSARFKDDILANGLIARGEGEGNWDEYPSRDDAVYLTTAYALYFAVASAELGEGVMVAEVDLDLLDECLLHPDEDIIGQSLAAHTKMDLKEATMHARENLEEWQHLWEESMNRMGNVAYLDDVPPHAITRVAVITDAWMKRNGPITMSMLDPTITPINYTIKGEWYRHFTRWVFGDEPELPHLTDTMLFRALNPELRGKRRTFLEVASRDRDGIQVITLPKSS